MNSSSKSNSRGVSSTGRAPRVTRRARASSTTSATSSRCPSSRNRARRSAERTRAIKLLQRERLGQVVVRPGVKPHDPVLHRASRRDHNDRCKRRRPDPAAHLHPVQRRQPEIEQHQIRIGLAHRRQRRWPIAHDARHIPGMTQLQRQRARDLAIILDHQHAGSMLTVCEHRPRGYRSKIRAPAAPCRSHQICTKASSPPHRRRLRSSALPDNPHKEDTWS